MEGFFVWPKDLVLFFFLRPFLGALLEDVGLACLGDKELWGILEVGVGTGTGMGLGGFFLGLGLGGLGVVG